MRHANVSLTWRSVFRSFGCELAWVEFRRPVPLQELAFSRDQFLSGLGKGLDDVGRDHDCSVTVGVDHVTRFDVGGAADVHWFPCFEDLDEGSRDSHSASEVREAQCLDIGEVTYEAIGDDALALERVADRCVDFAPTSNQIRRQGPGPRRRVDGARSVRLRTAVSSRWFWQRCRETALGSDRRGHGGLSDPRCNWFGLKR